METESARLSAVLAEVELAKAHEESAAAGADPALLRRLNDASDPSSVSHLVRLAVRAALREMEALEQKLAGVCAAVPEMKRRRDLLQPLCRDKPGDAVRREVLAQRKRVRKARKAVKQCSGAVLVAEASLGDSDSDNDSDDDGDNSGGGSDASGGDDSRCDDSLVLHQMTSRALKRSNLAR